MRLLFSGDYFNKCSKTGTPCLPKAINNFSSSTSPELFLFNFVLNN